jgi:hypothetical protein
MFHCPCSNDCVVHINLIYFSTEMGLGKTVQVNKLTLLNKMKITNHRKMVAPEVSLFLTNRLHMVHTVGIDLMYHIHISIAIWYYNLMSCVIVIEKTGWLAN